MPHTTEQWLWFCFYTGGAIGGWAYLVRASVEAASITLSALQLLHSKWKNLHA